MSLFILKSFDQAKQWYRKRIQRQLRKWRLDYEVAMYDEQLEKAAEIANQLDVLEHWIVKAKRLFRPKNYGRILPQYAGQAARTYITCDKIKGRWEYEFLVTFSDGATFSLDELSGTRIILSRDEILRRAEEQRNERELSEQDPEGETEEAPTDADLRAARRWENNLGEPMA